ncbi:glycosyltransferase [Sphingomonas aerophila]|uniref:Spore protein YkvP/CgeB glycosyl transferase-like domain-containing protein n=1 Tax=Sphingomonas aerophila TaxID=1344948 RepID=A0A7W9BC53_9SPHN|nr:glycosyltransferase [Sphingomonas aerophila]MBB5714313.1 hypothetical protein [Sphingomonas aerophila]
MMDGDRPGAVALASAKEGRLRSALPSGPALFVRPGGRDRLDLRDDGLPADVERSLMNLRGGPDVWILGTYLRLRRKGLDVELANDFRAGALCIAHRDDVRRSVSTLWRSFIVSVRADRERTFTCDLEIVQSPASIETPNAFYILHWPQPGLRPRDPSRGTRLERLGYFGELKNLAAGYRDPHFLLELAASGVELVVRDDPAEWGDYSDIDMVLAVRDGTPRFLAAKPATKLFNAWLAGCPAFVGNEPAFFHHHNSDLDFIPVGSPAEVLAQLRRLRENPALFQQLIERAQLRAADVTEDRVVEQWVGFIGFVAAPLHAAWAARAGPGRRLGAQMALGWGLFRASLRRSTQQRGFDLHGNAVAVDASPLRRMAWALDGLISRFERGKVQ